MNALENVAKGESDYLKDRRHTLFIDVRRTLVREHMSEFIISLPLYDLRYDSSKRAVYLFKTNARNAADQETKDLDLVKLPDQPEQQILMVAYQYILKYRDSQQYKPIKQHMTAKKRRR